MSRKRTVEPTLEEKAQRAQELEDIRFVMQTIPGRRVMWRMLSEANIFRSCFTGNSTTFYLEGKRDCMLPYYQDIMKACPELFWMAQQENIKLEKQEATANAERDNDNDAPGDQ